MFWLYFTLDRTTYMHKLANFSQNVFFIALEPPQTLKLPILTVWAVLVLVLPLCSVLVHECFHDFVL